MSAGTGLRDPDLPLYAISNTKSRISRSINACAIMRSRPLLVSGIVLYHHTAYLLCYQYKQRDSPQTHVTLQFLLNRDTQNTIFDISSHSVRLCYGIWWQFHLAIKIYLLCCLDMHFSLTHFPFFSLCVLLLPFDDDRATWHCHTDVILFELLWNVFWEQRQHRSK